MLALLEFFKTQVQQLEAEKASKDKPLEQPGKFHVGTVAPKQIPTVPVLGGSSSGLASLPHPVFFI